MWWQLCDTRDDIRVCTMMIWYVCLWESMITNAHWYVSNVSIIYEAFMLLCCLFWMFMGFTKHFYNICGTSLLTGGPSHIAVLLSVLVFQRKLISNGVQTEWNLRQRDFLEDYHPGGLEIKSEDPRGGHKIGGRAPLLGAPPVSWTRRASPDRLLSPIYSLVP